MRRDDVQRELVRRLQAAPGAVLERLAQRCTASQRAALAAMTDDELATVVSGSWPAGAPPLDATT